MHHIIYVSSLIFIISAHPTNREGATHEKRSLFHDVIESLRIRSQLPDDDNQNENNLAQAYNQYGYDHQQLPSDTDFIPRRNDRIEMPGLKYRFPKSLNDSEDVIESKQQEIVVFIDTTKEPKTTTVKPKKPKRTRPPVNKIKPQKDEEAEVDEVAQKPDKPLMNTMAGQSQIGNRESQMVVKPTVIVNIRGSVKHRDGEIRIAGRNTNESGETYPIPNSPQNIFNINQEIKLERTFAGMGSSGQRRVPNDDKGNSEESKVKIEENSKLEEDMMMCETATWNPEKNRGGRKFGNVLQILFSL